MYNMVFFVLIAILIVSFLFERILSLLEIRNTTAAIPDELSDVYDKEKYKKQQAYQKTNSKFGLLTSSFSFLLTLAMFVFGGFAFVDGFVQSYTQQYILVPLLFFGVIMFASDILNIPFELYDTFVIEEKFGFNKTRVKTYLLDKLKGWVVGVLLGGLIMVLIVWFYYQTRELFWLYTWIAVTVFTVFMSMFYSNLIVPLFNKQTPLEEGELRNAIEAFALKTGFNLTNVYKIDGSKRSTKANAYFTGFGPKKRIVLYDTLINDLSTDEIVAVLAHEIGHYKHKHTVKGLLTGIMQTGATLYILSLFISNPLLSEALGSDTASFHLGLVAFGVLFSPINLFVGIVMNVFSRKNEYQADNFAKQHADKDALIGALKNLSRNNLSNLTPHKAVVFVHYSHPTLLQRINALNS